MKCIDIFIANIFRKTLLRQRQIENLVLKIIVFHVIYCITIFLYCTSD